METEPRNRLAVVYRSVILEGESDRGLQTESPRQGQINGLVADLPNP
jgi:hypothetical protein